MIDSFFILQRDIPTGGVVVMGVAPFACISPHVYSTFGRHTSEYTVPRSREGVLLLPQILTIVQIEGYSNC